MTSPSLSVPSLSGDSNSSASSSSSSITTLSSSVCSIPQHDGCGDEPTLCTSKAAPVTADELVRLFQCHLCSLLLRDPVALPCGRTLCKTCLPQTYPRKGISFPGTLERLEGLTCPYPECGSEHAKADCAPDVSLENLLDQGRIEIERKLVIHGPGDIFSLPVADRLLVSTYSRALSGSLRFNFGEAIMEEIPEKGLPIPFNIPGPTGEVSDSLVGGHSRDVDGATKSATSETTETGAIRVTTPTYFGATGLDASTAGDGTSIDTQSLADDVTDAMRSEADCKVCYAIFYDPVTTTCGHTYCRPCLQRTLDIHPSCPLCRRGLSANTYFRAESSPANKRLGRILETLWPYEVQARRDAVRAEDLARETESRCDVPIFVCTVSLPTIPTVLHIFEPRYRLMIQRAMQGNRTFGMVLPREALRGADANADQSLPFAELGTLLRIENVGMFPDGGSLVEATGMSRFRIVRHSVLDDYVVARVERYDDISVAEEEALEASETAGWDLDRPPSAASFRSTSSSGSQRSVRSTLSRLSSSSSSSSSSSLRSIPRTPTLEEIDTMPTASLIAYASSTVEREWRRFSVANRGPQPADPMLLPWWLAAVLPTRDVAKYRVLRAVSLRERFQICCRWLVELEEGSAVSGGCVVL